MIAVRSFVVTAASMSPATELREGVRRGYRPALPTVPRTPRTSSAAHLAGERLVEDLLGDRPGEASAGAAGDLGVGALEHHGDGVSRGVGRRVGDDPGVRALRLARAVELGGARLGGDRDAV